MTKSSRQAPHGASLFKVEFLQKLLETDTQILTLAIQITPNEVHTFRNSLILVLWQDRMSFCRNVKSRQLSIGICSFYQLYRCIENSI